MEYVSIGKAKVFSGFFGKWASLLFFSLVLTGIFVSVQGVALAGQAQVDNADLAQKIEKAKTAQDHEALAAYYRLKAREADAQIKLHQKMRKAYMMPGQHMPYRKPHMRYCDNMIRSYTQIMQDDEALAEEHEQIARELSKKQ